MVCAEYSKAFDTVPFKAVFAKLHEMGFSKSFLLWVLSYLSERRQLVQKDDNLSEFACVELGVPQGSILGLVLFNLYVADLHKELDCPCYQYADETNFFLYAKVADLGTCVNDMNRAIPQLGKYSSDSNLALNECNTKWMLLFTKQMARVHSVQTASVNISCNGESLERVTRTKLLDVHMHEHLTWDIYINELVTSCYGALAVLKKLRSLAPFRMKKQLDESLILSKLDYAGTVFYLLPLCQLKRLERVENLCAGYVLGRYARQADSLQLGWLPLIERRSYQLLQCVFKALCFDYWPSYLRLRQYIPARDLRSSCEVTLKVSIESGTFLDSSAAMFNASYLRNCTDFRSFKRNLTSYLVTNARKRSQVT